MLYRTSDRHDHVVLNDKSHEEKQEPDMLVTYFPAINYSTFHSNKDTKTSLIIFRLVMLPAGSEPVNQPVPPLISRFGSTGKLTGSTSSVPTTVSRSQLLVSEESRTTTSEDMVSMHTWLPLLLLLLLLQLLQITMDHKYAIYITENLLKA